MLMAVRRIALAALLLGVGLLLPAHAGPNAASVNDPAVVNEFSITFNGPGNFRPVRDTHAKTLSNQTIDTTKKNLFLIYIGQSTDSNISPTAYSPANPNAIDNLNIYDGAIYKAVDPLLGASIGLTGNLGNPCTVLLDALVTAGSFDRTICAPIAIDGSIGVEWATGQNSTRAPVAAYRFLQLRDANNFPVTCSTTHVTCAVICCYGETDNLDGTTQASWVATFTTLRNNVIAAGFSPARWFVARKTLFGVTSPAIEAAQWNNAPSGVINNSIGIFQGANADAITGNTCPNGGVLACRQDGVHWTNAGNISFMTDPTLGFMQAMHASGAPF